jgi:hypothetical protein
MGAGFPAVQGTGTRSLGIGAAGWPCETGRATRQFADLPVVDGVCIPPLTGVRSGAFMPVDVCTGVFCAEAAFLCCRLWIAGENTGVRSCTTVCINSSMVTRCCSNSSSSPSLSGSPAFLYLSACVYYQLYTAENKAHELTTRDRPSSYSNIRLLKVCSRKKPKAKISSRKPWSNALWNLVPSCHRFSFCFF